MSTKESTFMQVTTVDAASSDPQDDKNFLQQHDVVYLHEVLDIHAIHNVHDIHGFHSIHVEVKQQSLIVESPMLSRSTFIISGGAILSLAFTAVIAGLAFEVRRVRI
ncbi:hypothetical protein F4804DRAFT_330314 [Jackrogersella minutella]|nr:hypothetical protein F4804DRAFT_330314 [Jackrogersella minutella]